jgi:hypothetical protein
MYKTSLDRIKNFIRTSTSSMTAVPKPLKFLRPHYNTLTSLYETWPEGDDKVFEACYKTIRNPLTIYRLHSPMFSQCLV